MADRHPLGRNCGKMLPLVILLMPYALVRHGWATWRERRGAVAAAPKPYGPGNPQCSAQDSSGLDCGGPAGHPDGSDHANAHGTWRSTKTGGGRG